MNTTTQTQKSKLLTAEEIEALSPETKAMYCLEDLQAKIDSIKERGLNMSDVNDLVGYASAVKEWYEEA